MTNKMEKKQQCIENTVSGDVRDVFNGNEK